MKLVSRYRKDRVFTRGIVNDSGRGRRWVLHAGSWPSRVTISIAVRAASQPLLPALAPARGVGSLRGSRGAFLVPPRRPLPEAGAPRLPPPRGDGGPACPTKNQTGRESGQIHAVKELGIALGAAHAVDEQLHRLDRVH